MSSAVTTVETGEQGLHRASKVTKEYSWDAVVERLLEEGLRIGL